MARICDLLSTLDTVARKRVIGYVLQRSDGLVAIATMPNGGAGDADRDLMDVIDEAKVAAAEA